MTDDLTLDDDDLDIEEEPEDEKPSHLRKQISAQAKARQEAESERDALKRELAVRDSGLDLSDPKVAFFADKYDGEATAEAIKSAAAEAGFLEPPPPNVSDEVVAEHAAVAAITGGAEAAGHVDPRDAAYAEAVALGKAGTAAKVAEIYERHGLAGGNQT